MQHTINAEDRSTWRVGVFSDDKAPLLTVVSGDRVRYLNLPSHWGGAADDVHTI